MTGMQQSTSVAMLFFATSLASLDAHADSAIELASLEVSPGRAKDEVFEALDTAKTKLAACFQASFDTRFGGASVTIERDGTVSRVDVSADAGLAACIRPALLRLQFTPHTDTQIAVLRFEQPPIILGSLDKQTIRDVVQSHALGIRACYESALKSSPNLVGKLKMKWVIAATGDVSQVQIEQNEMATDVVGKCMAGVIRGWTFPKPRGGGIVIVSYPFVFRRSG